MIEQGAAVSQPLRFQRETAAQVVPPCVRCAGVRVSFS